MTTPAPLPTVEIPSAQLADPKAFEVVRKQAYEADANHRGDALTSLVDHADLLGGTALSDVILEVLSRPSAETQRAHDELEKVSDAVAKIEASAKHDEATYQFVVDEEGGVKDVRKVIPVKEDKSATARSRHISKSVGWGPKRNKSSITIPDAPPRH